jgi:hypothetical protein
VTDIAVLVDKLRGYDGAIEDSIDWLSLMNYVEARSGQLRCTQHPLGFVHIELTPVAPLRDTERLRLHYWPHAGSSPDEAGTLHDHVWKLASVVAAGTLCDRTFRVVPDTAGTYKGIAVEYGHSSNRFTDCGRFELAVERELVVQPGQIYRIPSRTVHDSEVVDAPAVTFVLAEDDQDATTKGPLILQAGTSGSGTAVRESVHCAAVLSLVRRRLEATLAV